MTVARPVPPPELVVLLDELGRPAGTADKLTVHHTDTPLHLAFSCHVVGAEGRALMTRRALGKLAWPGVWTNSVCGHPAPGEAAADAVARRARQELGLRVSDVDEVLPDFAYRAVDVSGTVENERCPVFVARADADPVADPAEVAEWAWASWDRVVLLAASAPWALSPWCVRQVGELDAAGWRPA